MSAPAEWESWHCNFEAGSVCGSASTISFFAAFLFLHLGLLKRRVRKLYLKTQGEQDGLKRRGQFCPPIASSSARRQGSWRSQDTLIHVQGLRAPGPGAVESVWAGRPLHRGASLERPDKTKALSFRNPPNPPCVCVDGALEANGQRARQYGLHFCHFLQPPSEGSSQPPPPGFQGLREILLSPLSSAPR